MAWRMIIRISFLALLAVHGGASAGGSTTCPLSSPTLRAGNRRWAFRPAEDNGTAKVPYHKVLSMPSSCRLDFYQIFFTAGGVCHISATLHWDNYSFIFFNNARSEASFGDRYVQIDRDARRAWRKFEPDNESITQYTIVINIESPSPPPANPIPCDIKPVDYHLGTGLFIYGSDIDECSVWQSACDYSYSCKNTLGSYQCVCDPGQSCSVPTGFSTDTLSPTSSSSTESSTSTATTLPERGDPDPATSSSPTSATSDQLHTSDQVETEKSQSASVVGAAASAAAGWFVAILLAAVMVLRWAKRRKDRKKTAARDEKPGPSQEMQEAVGLSLDGGTKTSRDPGDAQQIMGTGNEAYGLERFGSSATEDASKDDDVDDDYENVSYESPERDYVDLE